ncbi:HlyD family efflux transporter periplasmic adaptor subunit [Pseudomonas sp.]|uniref:HlyD family efflux transporter periplasmic adaptor subunit n=1 Tax=Pseudomonas sp. TaxID=306 RepID=UPI003BB4B224
MKKMPIILVALCLVAVAFWAGLQFSFGKKDDTLVLHGNVDIRQISLAFDGNGRIASLSVDEGEGVHKGDVVAVLDTRTLELQAEQAQAQIEVQQQNLKLLRSGSRPQEIAQARSRTLAAQADAARAAQDQARLQGIADSTKGRGVSAQDLDRVKSSVQVARATVAERQEAQRLTEIGPRQEELAGAEAQLKASQAQLALLQHQAEQGQLKAPADAVVRSRLLEPGDMVTPQRPVLALALTEPKWVRVYVNEPDLGRVKPGMSASVFTDTSPERAIVGTVGYISSVAEFTPKAVQTEELRSSLVYEVRVLVKDPDNSLRLGQPATVKLATGAAQ